MSGFAVPQTLHLMMAGGTATMLQQVTSTYGCGRPNTRSAFNYVFRLYL